MAAGEGATAIELISNGGIESGAVTMSLADNLVVNGNNSKGVLAASISNNIADAVSFNMAGSLKVNGDNATGINLMSNGAMQSGEIVASLDGNTIAIGKNVVAIQAHSQSDILSGDVVVNISGDVFILNIDDALESASSLNSIEKYSAGIDLQSISADISGDISLTVNGNIDMRSNGRAAILLSSTGGTQSGSVTLTVTGDVMAVGDSINAIILESISDDVAGNITFINAENNRIYAGDGGVGISIIGGDQNNITINGIIHTSDKLGGMAILGSSGNDNVINNNYFYGQFDLGAGVNSFINSENAVFITGAELILEESVSVTEDSEELLLSDVSLAKPATLSARIIRKLTEETFAELDSATSISVMENSGDLVLSDIDLAQSTTLTGSFIQKSTGKTFAELDFSTDLMDQFLASGTADLDGEVYMSLLNPQLIPVGTFSKVLFGGEMGVVDNGLVLFTAPSVVINYDLDYSSGTTAKLNYNVDFAPQWLSKNLIGVGEHFNEIQRAGSSPELSNVIIKLIYDANEEIYRNSLSQISPELYGIEQSGLIHSAQKFSSQMMSCSASGQYHKLNGDTCFWSSYGKESRKHDAHGDYKTFNQELSGWSIGVEKPYNNFWSFGFAGSQITADINSGDIWSSVSETTQYGLSANYRDEDIKFSSSLSYGKNDSKSQRKGFLLESFQTHSNRNMTVLSGLLGISHDFSFGVIQLRPKFEFGYNHLQTSAANETGAEFLNLNVDSNSETFVWIQPGIEVGFEYEFESKNRFGIFFNLASQRYLGESNTYVFSGLEGAPIDADPMKVGIDLGKYSRVGQISLSLLTKRHWHLLATYNLLTSEHYRAESGEVKISVPF